jgi:predicted naringenin-chalcone synthase
LAEIISIATTVPQHGHAQKDILRFMEDMYKLNAPDSRKLAYLYKQSGIEKRYSVIPDYSLPRDEWEVFPNNDREEFLLLDERMKLYRENALPLTLKAARDCIDGHLSSNQITHLITVSCTGMSAPGLDLQLAECLKLPADIFRTSVNFMGCYAAVHALKLAKLICDTSPKANVLIAVTELCTIHFQKEFNTDNAASSLLFADGSAAILVSASMKGKKGVRLKNFHSQIIYKGKADMSWELSSKGFLMSLSSYIPDIIQEDISALLQNVLKANQLKQEDISHWCIHPGGKKILDAIEQQLKLGPCDLQYSRKVMANYGNMSSPTILFVLKEILDNGRDIDHIFGVAFGPGLTMETFIASGK